MRASWSWFGALALVAGCAEPPVPAVSAAVPPPAQRAVPIELPAPAAEPPPAPHPWRAEIYKSFWPSLDATLLGVDVERRRAFIKLRTRQPARYVIDTIDIDDGKRIERWQASSDQAAGLADYDARFAPLDGAPEHDLGRLAAMVAGWSSRALREGSAWPVADASPTGDRVVFMRAPTRGGQGDWLFLHDVSSARAVRIGRQAVASYDAKFSPDGEHLAWRGCVGNRPCRYALYLSSVDAAAKGQAPQRIHTVREPRGPIWSPDSQAVLSLANGDRGERCVTKTTVPSRRPWRLSKTSNVVCDPKLVAFVLSPSGESILYTKRDGHAAEVTWQSLADHTPPATVQLRQTSELSVSNSGLVLADHQHGMLALDLKRQRRRLITSDDGAFVFVPNIQWLSDDTALMLEKSFADGTIRLVRVDVPALLDET